jgi:hypothetical protein
MPWPLPERDDDLLALAKSYPFAAPDQSYLFRDGRALGLGDVDLSGRWPVLAHGSNRAPEHLSRKFTDNHGREAEIPVIYAWLADHDVVYSAHVTQYGAVASTLQHSPGCRVNIAVTWLTEAQLARMHETEGRNYPFGRLLDIELELEAGEQRRLDRVWVYASDHGCLALDDAPVGLAAVAAEGRTHRSLSQEEALTLVRDRHHPQEELDRHILANIADGARRAALIAELRGGAIPATLPHFQPA